TGLLRSPAIIVAAALAALPLLLTSALIRQWNPYYAVFPALGSSIVIGVLLARAPKLVAIAVLVLFLGMGLWTREASPSPEVTCEANLAQTSDALLQVEQSFKMLRPVLPAHAELLVSVASSGRLSIYTHMYRFQALRVWYH